MSQIFRNRGVKVQDDTKQTQEVSGTRPMAKRTAKNSVFLDLFQDKKNLLIALVVRSAIQLDGKYFNQNTVVFSAELP